MGISSLKNNYIYVFIFAFVFLLYGNTVQNKYALDDAIVITDNQFVKKGFSGIADIFSTELFTGFFKVKKNLVEGGRYRPLSLVTFAIEYAFFGQNPWLSHLINIILYGLTGVFLYIVLLQLFKDRLYLPLLVTLLWLAHPLHTEVIANIKGRDEILAFLGSLISLYLILKSLQKTAVLYLILAAVVFFLALLSKEMSITFLAVIPLALYFFKNKTIKETILPVLVLLVPTLIFLYIRQQIIAAPAVTGAHIPQELMNDSFLGMSFSEKYATIFFTLIFYIKLLFVPFPLTYDYYPYHIHIMNFDNLWVIFSIVLHIALAVIAIKGFKQKTIIAFGVFYYAITFSPVSNLLFSIGAFMNERFMYMPSLGWAIVMAYLLIKSKKYLKSKFAIPVISSLFIIPFIILTITRNSAWANDYILFTTDVKTSFDSAKSNTSAGGKMIEEAEKLEKIIRANPISIKQLRRDIDQKTDYREETKNNLLQNKELKAAKKDINIFIKEQFKEAIVYLKKALEIHPTYTDPMLLLGNAYYKYNKDYEATWSAYEGILKQNPQHKLVAGNWTLILKDSLAPQKKIEYHKRLLRYNPYLFENNYRIGNLYGQYLHQLDSAIFYLEKARKLNANDARVYKDLGVAYGMKAQYKKALQMMLNSIKIQADDYTTFYNIGVTYKILGQNDKAEEYFKKGNQVKKAKTSL